MQERSSQDHFTISADEQGEEVNDHRLIINHTTTWVALLPPLVPLAPPALVVVSLVLPLVLLVLLTHLVALVPTVLLVLSVDVFRTCIGSLGALGDMSIGCELRWPALQHMQTSEHVFNIRMHFSQGYACVKVTC